MPPPQRFKPVFTDDRPEAMGCIGAAHHGGAKGWYAASTLLIGQLASMLRKIRASIRNDTAMKES
jgi:hypothetical protein